LLYARAKLKEQEVRLAVELARIQGTVLQAHYDTLSAATELVSMAVKQQSAGQEIAKYQKQTADASFKGAESAAKAAYQSNITVKTSAAVATNTTIAAESAGKFAANLERGAQAAVNASKTVGSLPATGGAFPAYAGAGGIQNEAVRNQMMQHLMKSSLDMPVQTRAAAMFMPGILKDFRKRCRILFNKKIRQAFLTLAENGWMQ
jgi:hypothetical protein